MRTIFAALFVLAFARCATLDHGPMQRIHVGSDPIGATVTTKSCGPGSTKAATTDAVVWVSRRATRCTLTVAAPGFEPQIVPLRRAISDAFRDNALFIAEFCDGDALDCTHPSDLLAGLFLGGIFSGTGFGIDAATGAMFQLEPNHIYVELAPEEAER